MPAKTFSAITGETNSSKSSFVLKNKLANHRPLFLIIRGGDPQTRSLKALKAGGRLITTLKPEILLS
jgi:hypothetical protein